MENRTLVDYEREIHGLRNAMENLQVKLSDAERKLQEQEANGSTSGSDRSTSTGSCHSPHERPAAAKDLRRSSHGSQQTIISIPGHQQADFSQYSR